MAEQLRNEDGLTEEEFLEEYKNGKKYPAPYLTADNVIFRIKEDKQYVLLIKRGNHPWIGQRALPGGFVGQGENAAQAAARELTEETGLTDAQLAPVGLYSDPDRDPRGWIISEAFFSILEGDIEVEAGDDARDAKWFEIQEMLKGSHVVLMLVHTNEKLTIQGDLTQNPVSRLYCLDSVKADGLACDHGQIIADAWVKMRFALSQS